MTNIERASAFNLLQHVFRKIINYEYITHKQHGIKRYHKGLPENNIYC